MYLELAGNGRYRKQVLLWETPSKKRYGRPTVKKLYEREQNTERHVCMELEGFGKTVGPMIAAANLFRKGKGDIKEMRAK